MDVKLVAKRCVVAGLRNLHGKKKGASRVVCCPQRSLRARGPCFVCSWAAAQDYGCLQAQGRKKAEGDKKDAKEKKKVKNKSKTKEATYGHLASQTPKLVRSLNHVLKLHFPQLAWNRVRVVLEPRQGASGMASVVSNFTTTGVISSKLPRESTSGGTPPGKAAVRL